MRILGVLIIAINRTVGDEDSASLCRGLQERRRRIMRILYKAETEDISDMFEASKDAEVCCREVILENYSINEKYKTELATILQTIDFDSAEARVLKLNTSKKIIDTLIFLETSNFFIIKSTNCLIHN